MTLPSRIEEQLNQTPIEREIQLLVEGNDERNFFEALATHLSIRNMQIRNIGGKDRLRRFLRVFRKDPDFLEIVRTVGIVRDADASADSAFESVQDSLRLAELPVPDRAGAPGGVAPTVSVLIMPDNERHGMLETILRDTFANLEIDRCIEAYLECVRGLPGVDLQRPDKARVHAWIATRPDPHVSVGVAAKKGYWDMDHPALGGVREFLLALRDGAGGP